MGLKPHASTPGGVFGTAIEMQVLRLRCASLRMTILRGGGAGEVEEGEGGEALEEAGEDGEGTGVGEVGAGFVYLGVEAGEVFVGDLLEGERAVGVGGLVAVLAGEDGMGELDALVGVDEVGAGVEACAITGRGEDGGESGGGRAFAVGAGDEDRGHPVLGVAEVGAEGAHVGEVEFAGGALAGGGG